MKISVPGLALIVILLFPGASEAAGQGVPWGREWLQVRTASVRVFFESGQEIAPGRLRELETAVQRIADELGLDDAARASLRTQPIDYLYARDRSTLESFGVAGVDGIALVGERRILATHLPEEHELVHVLAQVAILPAPDHNQPWLQEGLASYLGGHLGQSPLAVLATGDDTLDRHPGLIPRLLTASGFRESTIPAEERYAASARFVHYLDDAHGGREPLLELLRLLAGDGEEVVLRPASIVETQLEGVYDTSFAELMDGFEVWRADRPVAGVRIVTPPRRSADLVISDSDHLVRWWIDETGWVIAVMPRLDRIDLSLVWGSRDHGEGVWTAPSGSSGCELRLDETGGGLVDLGRGAVVMRWFDRGTARGESGEVVWFFPAQAVSSTPPPAIASQVSLWSQPRFLVE